MTRVSGSWLDLAGVHAGLRVILVKIWVSAEKCDLPWFVRRPPQLGNTWGLLVGGTAPGGGLGGLGALGVAASA